MKRFIITLLIMAFGASSYATITVTYPRELPVDFVVPAGGKEIVRINFPDPNRSHAFTFEVMHPSCESVTYNGVTYDSKTSAPKVNGNVNFYDNNDQLVGVSDVQVIRRGGGNFGTYRGTKTVGASYATIEFGSVKAHDVPMRVRANIVTSTAIVLADEGQRQVRKHPFITTGLVILGLAWYFVGSQLDKVL